MVSKITGPIDPSLPTGDAVARAGDQNRERHPPKKEREAAPEQDAVETDFSLAAIEALLVSQGAAERSVLADIALLQSRGITHLALRENQDILAAIAAAADLLK